MSFLPGGTLTFLFTDIEGSTKLWEQFPDAMPVALARHDELLRDAIMRHQGVVFKTVGDAFHAVFAVAPNALLAALALQQALNAEDWGQVGTLKVRAALHTGIAQERDNDYFGTELSRAARLLGLGYGGQVLLSQSATALCRDYLPPDVFLRDLGMYRLKDLLRPEQVFQVVAPDLQSEFPALKSLDALPTNLPQQTSSFIGREQEMRDVADALRDTRLLTLTGSGGTGKTRLSLQVAADALEQYPDGVWLIELAALKDPLLIPSAITSALQVKEEPGRALTDTITDFLRSKTVLLVIDNCEHLVEACALFAEILLQTCPNVRILASSREALRISGESIYRVPPLSLPNLRQLPPAASLVETLTQYEAVRLFIERAVAMQPTFQVTNHNAPAVAQICSRLDGIPLAIELAAARIRVLPPEQIAARLDDRFKLLTGGSRAALPRQQTLKALIDWSYTMLSEEEQALFMRLSVFSGGWSLEAAEAIANDERGMMNDERNSESLITHHSSLITFDVLDTLTSLVDKSLVVYNESDAQPRYRMLETLRQYGQDRLFETGEMAVALARHCDWFVNLARQAEPQLMAGEQQAWLETLEREHDNIRAALDWRVSRGELDTACQLTFSIWRFWMMRGYFAEGRRRIQSLLDTPEISRQWFGRLALTAGNMAYMQGDLPTAEAHYQSAMDPLQEGKHQPQLASLYSNLSLIAWQKSDLDVAGEYANQSLQLRRDLQDRHGIATSLNSLGNIARSRSDFEAALKQFMEAADLYRELGDRHSLAIVLYSQAGVAYEQEEYERMRALYMESLAINEELENRRGVADALMGLGSMCQNTQQPEQAQAYFERSLAIHRDLGNVAGELVCLYNLGALAMEQSEWETAQKLMFDSLRLCETTGESYIFWGILQAASAFFMRHDKFEEAAQLIAAVAQGYPATRVEESPAARKLDLLRQQARHGVAAQTFAQATIQGASLTREQMIALARQS